MVEQDQGGINTKQLRLAFYSFFVLLALSRLRGGRGWHIDNFAEVLLLGIFSNSLQSEKDRLQEGEHEP